jgi:hypothetical protein
MHMFSRSLGLWFCLASAMCSANAMQRGSTKTGIVFVSGGAGQSERTALSKEKNNFSFGLITAAKGSGVYLAAVRVRILNASTQQPVLEHTMDGPWLLANLPPGDYAVEASYTEAAGQPAQTLKQSATIKQGDHHQMALYFDTKDSLAKDSGTSFRAGAYNKSGGTAHTFPSSSE